MTTKDMSDLLEGLFNEIAGCEDDDEMTPAELDPDGTLYECQASSFRDCGLLTSNDGVVLTLRDGTEFQITIVRSR
ncbi:MAG TPA: hypothetical protein PLL20_01100 [Phycisphaerae bacterium]|nr:hypothetical protein [Phycisphaerae bacterium]HRR84749.1 hypothetical protein [Phycisphaerae bacterium]